MNIMTMPLAGMEPKRKAESFDREEAEDRAFRMLSEGELFYVETDVMHDVSLDPARHDHSHLGGVSLETITAARHLLEAPAKRGPSSVETEATSRTSSQDTAENESKGWEQQEVHAHRRPAAAPAAAAAAAVKSNVEPFYPAANRISLKEAQEWDFSKKLEDLASESRGRERSFSEPQLSSLSHSNNHHWKDVNERAECEACADACAALTEGLRRVWSLVFPEEQHNHGIGTLRSPSSTANMRVNHSSRHFASCTSTKTFEVSTNERDKEALEKLGVVPDISYHVVGTPASMTFTMHIAGYRVVSTILGMHAEYEVRLKGAGRRWSKWQRFSKFKTIAACTQGDPDAAAAWRRVVRAKPHYRCLNPDYLAHKCNLLETFLQQVLFAMPTPALLIHFVSQKN
ncbi:hypothetical protein Esi_0636_0007 [Ectocarpus siliculosus]|uniref:PX domain-containing protein n=1 Tax=Ectocarpus siliculosus TaxID=2880 RepID=D7G5E1_ECTSI|nr:hypothetical protein Esi_0636_0007 [Ectocarpus siliculosus]|eukprot:CBJ33835.1 hypothetical protein Esi_0636_0007 [Ectocarpus siliculosus]